jgi:hypothetical protein
MIIKSEDKIVKYLVDMGGFREMGDLVGEMGG